MTEVRLCEKKIKADGCEGRTAAGHGVSLPDGGHSFDGGVVQVLGRRDGQAALAQDPLGLVHVGPCGGGSGGEGGHRGGRAPLKKSPDAPAGM